MLWQIISITIAKNEINDLERQVTIAKAELTHNQNQMDMLKAEIKEKNSFGSCVAIFSESFWQGRSSKWVCNARGDSRRMVA